MKDNSYGLVYHLKQNVVLKVRLVLMIAFIINKSFVSVSVVKIFKNWWLIVVKTVTLFHIFIKISLKNISGILLEQNPSKIKIFKCRAQ